MHPPRILALRATAGRKAPDRGRMAGALLPVRPARRDAWRASGLVLAAVTALGAPVGPVVAGGNAGADAAGAITPPEQPFSPPPVPLPSVSLQPEAGTGPVSAAMLAQIASVCAGREGGTGGAALLDHLLATGHDWQPAPADAEVELAIMGEALATASQRRNHAIFPDRTAARGRAGTGRQRAAAALWVAPDGHASLHLQANAHRMRCVLTLAPETPDVADADGPAGGAGITALPDHLRILAPGLTELPPRQEALLDDPDIYVFAHIDFRLWRTGPDPAGTSYAVIAPQPAESRWPVPALVVLIQTQHPDAPPNPRNAAP